MNTRLVVTAVIAAVSAGVAVALVVSAPVPSEDVVEATEAAEGAAWTVDAEDVLGNEFAMFVDPVGGEFGQATGGVIDAGDVLVARVALHNQETRAFEKSTFVGLDAVTGDVRWTASADGVESCSTQLLGGKLLCHNQNLIVTVEASNGSVERYETDWNIYGVATDGTDIYIVEGSDDLYSVTMHRGTLDDPDARWSRRLKDTYVGPYVPGDVIEFAGGVGVGQFSSGMVLFDAATGEIAEDFAPPDCARGHWVRGDEVYVIVGRDCSDSVTSRTELVDSTGRAVAELGSDVYQNVVLDETVESGDPIVFGDSAFDAKSGNVLWTADDALNGGDIAIVEGVVFGLGNSPRNLVTGEPAWAPDVEPLTALPTAVHDGLAYVADWQDVVAIDPTTGTRRESVSVDGLLGGAQDGFGEVTLQESSNGVLVLNERRLNLIR